MTMTKRDAQALTYLARRIRDETRGCAPWDEAGTYTCVAELIGQNLGESVYRVVGHASDHEARTPGSIRRPFVPKRDETTGRRQPAKAGGDQECRRHPGEWAASCRLCSTERFTHPEDPVLDDPTFASGRALRAELRNRRESTTSPQEES